jgi:16S rRNA (uracil1498-N3)-methyltransferase
MSDRYFVEKPISADRVTLTGPEAHHLIHVMRAIAGTRVTLFDGSGDQFLAAVERVGRADVGLSILSREQVDHELPLKLTLGVALPKGDRQKWLVEKAVELGVTRIVPLRTERGVAQPVEQTLARLRRAVIEASKQCGRNRLLQIDDPQAWADFIASAAATSCRFLVHPGGKENAWKLADSVPLLRRSSAEDGPDLSPRSTVRAQPAAHAAADGDMVLAVGPEGGFADEEVARAVAAGWRTVDLGPRILRVETAALFLATVIAAQASAPPKTAIQGPVAPAE